MAVFSNAQKLTQRGKENANKIKQQQRICSKQQDKIKLQMKWKCGLPYKEFKIMVIKMLTEDLRIMQEQNENFNKKQKI